MALSLTSRNLPHFFFREKNRIRKIREKSGYKNPGIFDQILNNIHHFGLISEAKQKFSVIFTNLSIFGIEISETK